MLCSGCSCLPPPARPRDVIVEVRRSGFRSILPTLCSRCGIPVESGSLQRLLVAKIRQLEAFGLTVAGAGGESELSMDGAGTPTYNRIIPEP
jgi:hypothetical protein